MGLGAMAALALSSAAALMVLLGYAPIKTTILGISFSPRLIATWFIPAVDVIVTLYLIGGGWFGLTDAQGFMASMASTATCLGLSGSAYAVRKLLAPAWRRQYQNMRNSR